MMDAERIDKLILCLPRKEKVKILKVWKEYMKELSERKGKPIKGKNISLGGEKIMKRRIIWLKKTIKKKRK